MPFAIDNTTLGLLGLLAALLIYNRFFFFPSPLVHPLLLGKQSDVSAVRRKGETGVYRSFATGQGSPFAVRPSGALKTVKDIAHRPKASESAAVPRCILDTTLTDESLAEILDLLPRGLQALFPNLANDTSILTLIPPSPTTALPLFLLQLSSTFPLVILPSPAFLTTALLSSDHPPPGVVVVHRDLLDDVVEQVWEDRQDKTGVLVIGDPDRSKQSIVEAAAHKGVVVHFWEDVWDVAERAPKVDFPEPTYSDIHSYFYSATPTDGTAVTKVTHINVTAGIAGLLSIFPADKRPSPAQRDVVASSVRLDTPFGMTIAMASVYSGVGFRFIGPVVPAWPDETDAASPKEELLSLFDLPERPEPTVLFISKDHHRAIVEGLYDAYRLKPVALLVSRHKLIGIQGGDVSRNGLWEKVVWRRVRRQAVGGIAGDKLRAVVIVGEAPAASSLALSHLLLSMPISRVRPSAYSAGPVFASHFYDLQCHIPSPLTPQWDGEAGHTGPPANNVEVVLKGSEVDRQLEANEPAQGRVSIRGPAVLERVGAETPEGWVDTEEDAAVQTNGTFVFYK